MGILEKIFGGRKGEGEIEIVSRKPVGSFRVDEVFYRQGRQALVGEVLGGLIYPGYKVKGGGTALIREIQSERKKVDFAVSGDRVVLLLEGRLEVSPGQILEVYQS
ncbi:MAG: hypothetical protein PWQ79_1819 [Thermococcaceae archaeon]|nr:hypothetical protein [Thermococcaceae archaeon]MDK2914904.1 hypothetical protein [Thermococcaceae archaeon]